jgi:hypothetical protein
MDKARTRTRARARAPARKVQLSREQWRSSKQPPPVYSTWTAPLQHLQLPRPPSSFSSPNVPFPIILGFEL